MSFWRPFTDDAREVMIRANGIARETSGDALGPEEIFAAAAQEPPIREILAGLGAGSADLQRATDGVLPLRVPAAEGEATFTPDARRLIEKAFIAAAELDNGFVASEHLLLAYLELGPPRAMLDALKIEGGAFREALLAHLRARPNAAYAEKAPSRSSNESFAVVYRDAGILGKRRNDAQLWDILESAVRQKDAPGAAVSLLAMAFRKGISAPDFIAQMRKRAEAFLEE